MELRGKSEKKQKNKYFFRRLCIQSTKQIRVRVHIVFQLLKIDASDKHSIYEVHSTHRMHDKNNIFQYNFPFILIDYREHRRENA